MEVNGTDIRQKGIKGTLKEFVEVLDGIFMPSSILRVVEREDKEGLLDTPEKRKKHYRGAIESELIRLAVYGAVGYSLYDYFKF